VIIPSQEEAMNQYLSVLAALTLGSGLAGCATTEQTVVEESGSLTEIQVTSTKEFFPDTHQFGEEEALDVVDQSESQTLYDQDPYPIPPNTTLTRRDPYTDYRWK
jgi:hypothetical protein